jgi:transcriptional regulator of acetoin/glycerol metabolism
MNRGSAMERIEVGPGSAQVVSRIGDASDEFGRLIGSSESSVTSMQISSLHERPDALRALVEHLPGDDGHTSPSHAGTPGGLERIERDAIASAIWTHGGNLRRVAGALRIARSTLYLKVKKYALESILQEVRSSQ